MKRRYTMRHSQRLDWAIVMAESTRGWRRLYWRIVKRWLERGIC